ncbi:Putative Zinc finger C2H2-type, ankyrin repeat-containing domain superfamily [Septoria linicola]|uniref:Zinc finger C2H2-type, ankyrin repeat-containing domain superfamily n=1 Tax=Septoria linicola TaxID=215465 RepID=A0A9Q9EGX7_9PEZI|nr:putative Zinc finger C2H2-type, ankyrin repeat-containing domain superfamily [Septoria linicola]USW49307.1 Putative Zinc finger C2H2-type, ankyrin repeat-containing domain superfamily [Septoria linicola]
MNYFAAPPAHLRSPVDDGTRLGMIREESIRMAMAFPKQEPSPISDSSEQSQDAHLPPNKRARVNYECEACGTTYTEKRALARHRHTDMHRRRMGLPPDKRHLCVKCGRSFGRNHDLQRHRREQHGEATGATAVDMATCRSDDSHMSDDSTALKSQSSWSGPLGAMPMVDDMLLQPPHLRGAKSHGDLNSSRAGSTPSLSKSSSRESAPSIKTESNSDISVPIKMWPGDDDQRIFTPTPPREFKQRERRHSSDGLGELPPVRKDSSQPSRPSTATSKGSKDVNSQPSNSRIIANMIIDEPDVEGYEPHICLPCGRVFGDDDLLLEHLQTHLDSFKGNYKCKKCQIGFDHEEDLQKHLDSAKRGKCGFNFPHSQPCTGHHPPPARTDNMAYLHDSDCARLTYQLRNWEQAQLQAYISQINQLVANRQKRSKSRWSAEALVRSKRNSVTSFRSSAVSVNTYASAPCDTSNGKMDIDGLQKRLKNMSMRDVGSSVKNAINRRGGAISASTSKHSGTHDKALHSAVQRGELQKANDLLLTGADPWTLHRSSGTIISAALWAQTEVQSLTVAHRLTEDIQGACKICKLNSANFNKSAPAKVRALIDHGADVDQPGGLCNYPINSAAWMCNAEVVVVLLQKGANVHQRDDTFGSPLGIAASQAGFPKSEETVNALLNWKANPFIAGREGSPLEIARRKLAFWEKSPENIQIAPNVVDERVDSCEAIISLLEQALERWETMGRSEQISRYERSVAGNL